ncbi:MAG: glycine C-acetyltransferase [Chloroflexota bacterium]|nr:glycine C-acetyltransferase [Chloroflexota bacterium]
MAVATGRLDYLGDVLEELKQQGLYRELRVLEGEQDAVTTFDGREVINLSSNNYLGLNTHPKLRQAAIEAVERYGAGSGSVRTIAGTMTLHQQLEERLAEFKHTEAALTLQSGYAANVGAISTLLSDEDVVISDALNHASLIDGIRLTKAARKIYKHCDMDALEQALRESDGYKHRIVVTDGVFSMDGDIAPLRDVVELCERYDAVSYVDDAHASGVLGDRGRGTTSHFGLDGRVDVQIGTLSKAIGVLGGYVASTRHMRNLLIHRARPFLFSTSHPPAVAAACIAALEVLETEPELMDRLWENACFFKAGLERLGFDTGASETPITPVIIGELDRTMQFSDRLFQQGVFAQGIGYPTVARDKGRVRTIVTASHTQAQLQRALDVFEQAGREMGII